MEDLLERVRSGLRGRWKKNGLGLAARSDDDRSLLLSVAGTVLLSAACLIVLWLHWERENCLEDRVEGVSCSIDLPESRRAANDDKDSPKYR